jgi:erythronate-4-phosphate dehydrogenase
MTICIDSNIPFLPKLLKECGEIHTFHGRELTADFLKKTSCDALFIRSTVKANETLLKNTQLKFIATATAGTDHVDEEYLTSAGIVFKSAGGSNANAVAEYVIFSALLWADLLKTSLKNKTIGIIGYGNIGRRVAFYAEKLELRILVNDPFVKDFAAYCESSSLENLLKKSDIITNHVPLTTGGNFPTKNLLKSTELEFLKKDSLVIHASRGGVIEQNSLEEILLKDQIFAAIDVWEGEPNVIFKDSENLLLATPHIAGHTWNAKLNGTKMVADAFKTWSGCEPENEFLKTESDPDDVDFSDEKALLKTLVEKRKLEDDSEAFKKILQSENVAAGFDEMRKFYPQRFETLVSPFDNF